MNVDLTSSSIELMWRIILLETDGFPHVTQEMIRHFEASRWLDCLLSIWNTCKLIQLFICLIHWFITWWFFASIDDTNLSGDHCSLDDTSFGRILIQVNVPYILYTIDYKFNTRIIWKSIDNFIIMIFNFLDFFANIGKCCWFKMGD